MPKLLIETRMNSLSLCESRGDKKLHPGCLGTLEGPCADYVNPTRNNNFYSRKLWENVFRDPIVKESLEDRILIGELDHPGDRLETKAVNACIVMTGYSFDDDKGLLNGTFDILDTPNGRILKSLLDAGCKIGVSSRGEGDVETLEDVDNVDEDTYNFVGFDAVVLPAVRAAKPTLRESMQRSKSLRESIQKEIDGATSRDQVEMLRKVVEASGLPESDSLVESLDNKTQELSEGSTRSSNLLEDLEKANERIEELTGQVDTLTASLTTCKSRLTRQIQERQKLVVESRRQKKAYEDLSSKYSTLVFESADAGKTSDADKKIIESLKSALAESKKYAKKLRERLTTSRTHCLEVGRQVESLQEELTTAKADKSVSAEAQTKIEELTRQVRSLQVENAGLKKSNQELNESLRVKSSKLTESVKRSKMLEAKRESASSSLLTEYATLKSTTLGVDPKLVLEGLSHFSSAADVDRKISEIVERMDRYKKLPIMTDRALIESMQSGATVRMDSLKPKASEEDQLTESFMRQAMKQNH